MSCGATRTLSRIKLAWFVFKHPEWKCKPWCLRCEFFDNCLYEYEAETGETIEGIPIDYDGPCEYADVCEPETEYEYGCKNCKRR